MKRLLVAAILASGLMQPALARTLEIEVHGMTCAFCVDSLQRTFNKNPLVKKVDVSLEQKKVRLVTDGNLPTEETIRKMILDAGFTPIRITVLPGASDG
jgi:copper chaperone CopZ